MDCIVFGGWAEELAGAIAARPHKDIDLLYIGDSFEKVDAFIRGQQDIEEIQTKRFPHKRAFLHEGVMTEVLLLSRRSDLLVTDFWNHFEFEWPDISAICVNVQGCDLMVSAPHVVKYYRQHEKEIADVRARHAPNSLKK